MINRPEMKRRAKESMKQHKEIYIITIVFMVIGFVISTLSLKLNYPGLAIADIYRAAFTGQDSELVANAMMHTTVTGTFIDTLMNIMYGIVGVGFSLCCLSISRFEKVNVGMLFDPFGYFLKCVWINILIGLKVFAWTLLFIIPGIVAAYRYRFALYCFIDNPDLTASQCIAKSCELTRGHKGELFVLDLSFIGWGILTLIPFVAIFVSPYMETTNANFYNELLGYTPDSQEPVITDGSSGTFDSRKDPWE